MPTTPPGALVAEPSDFVDVPGGAMLWRIHWVRGAHPMEWNEFRSFGPLATCRYDHHPPPQQDHPGFGISYTAMDLATCVGEVFQASRVVSPSSGQQLSAWRPVRPLRLLDLRDTWAIRNGAAFALAAHSHAVCRRWAAKIHASWPDLDGLLAPSTMTGRAMPVLFERARNSFASAPDFSQPLDAAGVWTAVKAAADSIGYLTR